MASVKVAVRVRPFNQRELDMDAKVIIQMKGKKTGILNSKANTRDENIRYKEFTFDYSYWSHDTQSEDFASQELVYNDLGTEVVECAFQGYNACVFAYGQTGSGKTFTMMGSPDNQGLIPRICKALFERMSEDSKKGTTHRVHVSYLEIYQERVADLLRGRSSSLRVREHPKKGPYVEGLTTCLVTNYGHIQECMNRGNAHRTTAATNMNDVSSRSHAIFTITFVQAGYCNGIPSETVSKIHLVDLAGSERADSTGATGERLKEGAHINKSLVTLGSVISGLAEVSAESNGHRKSLFIPYRDSVLTWLLKDSLGGNSKTIMIAAISPADCNYGETLSTLRYANRAKNIINKPTINEDPNVKLIRELREEISKLRALMFSEPRSDMLAQIHEKEAREKELTEEWTSKWREAHAILREQKALGLRKAGPGVVLDSDKPHLVAIDDDPLSTGVTLYQLKEGETTIGTEESSIKQDIVLRGPGMESQHCSIILEKGTATLFPKPNAQIWLNSNLIESPARLTQGCIIFIGRAHVFRFNDPVEAAELRKGERTVNLSRMSLLSWSTPDLGSSFENLQTYDGIENEKISLAKEKEDFEKEQEAFEKRRKTLEEAQIRLQIERRNMQLEHAAQTRQLEEDWRNLAAVQQKKELELIEKEQDLIFRREELEKERKKLLKEIGQETEILTETKKKLNRLLMKTSFFIKSYLNEFTFPEPNSKALFQDLVDKSTMGTLSDEDSSQLVSLLNEVSTHSKIQDLVIQHRQELARLQVEIERRMQILSDRRVAVESLDKKIIGLVEQQLETTSGSKIEELQDLKLSLARRTQEELQEIEQRKQSLTLNLKCVNSAQSPDSCEVNCSSSLEKATLSSDTYHTATSACSTNLLTVGGVEHLMSDSGVELRPSPHLQEDSDISSTDDLKGVVSDSQSTTSSIENSHINRRRRRDHEKMRRLSQQISLQKQIIMRSLDSDAPKDVLNEQIANLQELQKQYMSFKIGSPLILSPATEHPLQDSNSPLSPVRPVHRGSTSALYSPSLQSSLSPLANYNLYRSMPSIPCSSDNEALLSITGYFLRGAGKRTHYEYEVRIITSYGEWWSVLRRYSRFRDLHLSMKAKYGEKVAQIPFPPRQLFANSEHVAQSRKRQLETYLRRLIEVCKAHPSCCLAYGNPISKTDLINFSPFFSKGVFENGKYGTS
ncbi:hypothetical protein FQR65_LT03224 [Abscondita terminalis]|nr:hypothetical protein FQR65_LT03224 [Abscondita terminalis]